MSDKSDLERDIELHELYRIPAAVKILIAFLIICLCALSLYTIHLKKELSKKEQEISLMRGSPQMIFKQNQKI